MTDWPFDPLTPMKYHAILADPPWKYVEALAGSDIQTNPPATNDAADASGRTFSRTVDRFPPAAVLDEIDAKIDCESLEAVLMDEGIQKFADPQKALLELIETRAVTTPRNAAS